MLVVMELLGARAALVILVLFIEFIDVALRRDLVVCLCIYLILNTVPDGVDALLVVQTLKDAITADHEEIEVVFQFEHFDLRLAHNDVLISTVLSTLSFDVSEGAGNREPAGKHSQRTLYIKIFFIWSRCSLRKCLGSVDLTTSRLDSYPLLLVVGLVVARQHGDVGSCI